MEIFINNHKYVLQTGTYVKRQPRQEWANQIRTTGIRRRQDMADISTWEMGDVSGGFGVQRMNVEDKLDTVSFWDSEVNTFFPRQVTLPPLRYVSSFSPMSFPVASGYGGFGTQSYPFKLIFSHGGYIWGVPSKGIVATESGSDDPNTHVPCYKFTGGGWLGAIGPRFTGTFENLAIFDETKYLGNSILLGAVSCHAGTHQFTTSPKWAVVGIATIAGRYTLLSFVATSNVPTEQKMCSFSDGNLYVFHYDGSVVRVYYCGSNYTFALKFTAGVNSAPVSAIEYLNYSGTAALFLCTQDYLYEVDLTNSQLIPRIDMTSFSSSANGVGMRVYQGELIIPTKRGMIAYNYTGTYEMIGLDLGAGLPAAKKGDHTILTSTPDILVESIQAEDSCVYGLKEGGWHFVTKGAVASQAINPMIVSALDDGIQRLHWIAGTLPYFVTNPFENPLQISGATFATEGKLTLPQFDDGMPEIKGGFFSEFIDAESLSAQLRIQCLYGFNSAAPTQQLGIATVANTELKFASGVGTEANIIQPQFNLLRGTLTGTTPVFRIAVLKYLKKPDIREFWDITIDGEATAKSRRGTDSSENILEEIGSLTKSRVQMPFQYGMMATRLVMVYDAPGQELEVAQPPRTELQERRTGLISLRLMEMLAR